MDERIIRLANISDCGDIQAVYESAKAYMRKSGNMSQWANGYPSERDIMKDIANGNLYVVVEKGVIHGVFAFIVGEDLTYKVIEGEWHSDTPYGTIHRIASDGKIRGIFKSALDFCFSKINHLRIDTHKDNKIMLQLINENRFEYCGIIYVADKTPRFAFERTE